MTPEEEGAVLALAEEYSNNNIELVKTKHWLLVALTSHVSRELNAPEREVRQVLKEKFFTESPEQ